VTRQSPVRAIVALATAIALVAPPCAQLLTAQAPASPAKASTKPAAKPAPANAPVDGGWPRTYDTASGVRLVLYQPQIANWNAQKQMVAYAAVSYAEKGAEKPVLGTIKVESATRVALEDRLVNFEQFTITETNFGSASREQVQAIIAEVNRAIPRQERVIALDRVLASVDKSLIRPSNVEGVKSDPPTIFYSTAPAVVVNFDGDPIWSPIKENDLKYAVNTNWDVFEHAPTKTYFLRNEAMWLKATSTGGPWTPAGTLPASFSKLPADENWKEVKASLPGKKVDPKQVPTVFVSTTPAELIAVRGVPSYLLVSGTKNLLWVQNTESDVFRVGNKGPVYYLVAGRWFSAPDFTGPWTFATPKLPAEFADIPLEHPRSRVRASVPGTDEAAQAVLLAQIPQTARVNRKEVKAPEVNYEGAPKFEAIPQTTVARAVNTDKDIIKVGDLYYLLFQGVWFMSKSAEGPWEVTSSVPKAVYEIPASSPAHNVTYVTVVEDDSDDEWVTYAAVAGYTGMMVAWGCAVWGTGWYYPPYIGYGGYYPVYYPFYPTYGYSAWYNPWSGTYGRSAVAYGPYGGIGATARYNPRTGTYARGAVAYGPYGARGAAQAYNPRTGTYAQTRQGSGVYGSWGSTAVQRGDDWAQTSRVTNRATGNTTRVTRTDEGGAVSRRGPDGGGFVAGGGDSGNIYAGHDGNVYRRNDSGSWDKYENGGWNNTDRPAQGGGSERPTEPTPRDRGTTPTQRPTDTVNQLDRDRAARTEGATRTKDYGSYRSGGGSSGSYRATPSRGGGGRGGGGRRR
jgi:hypothetical protein